MTLAPAITDEGILARIRALAGMAGDSTAEDYPIEFGAGQLAYYYQLAQGDERLAAYHALTATASRLARSVGAVRLTGYEVQGPEVAKELRAAARALLKDPLPTDLDDDASPVTATRLVTSGGLGWYPVVDLWSKLQIYNWNNRGGTAFGTAIEINLDYPIARQYWDDIDAGQRYLLIGWEYGGRAYDASGNWELYIRWLDGAGAELGNDDTVIRVDTTTVRSAPLVVGHSQTRVPVGARTLRLKHIDTSTVLAPVAALGVMLTRGILRYDFDLDAITRALTAHEGRETAHQPRDETAAEVAAAIAAALTPYQTAAQTAAAIAAALTPYQTAAQTAAAIAAALTPYHTATQTAGAIAAALMPYHTATQTAGAIVQALIPYSTTAQMTAAINAAVSGLSAGGQTAQQVMAAITAALADYSTTAATTAARTAAITAALADYSTTAGVRGLIAANLSAYSTTAETTAARTAAITAALAAYEPDQAPDRTTLPPMPWHIGQRFTNISGGTLGYAKYLRGTIDTPQPTLAQLAVDYAYIQSLSAYTLAYGGIGAAALRNRAFVVTAGAPTTAQRAKQIRWAPVHPASATTPAATYQVAQAIVPGLQHWYAITGMSYATFIEEVDEVWYNIQFNDDSWLLPDGAAPEGVVHWDGEDWISVPTGDIDWDGVTQPVPRRLLPHYQDGRIHSGPGIGLAVTSTSVNRAGAATPFVPALTLAAADRGVFIGSATVTIAASGNQQLGFGPGLDQAVDIPFRNVFASNIAGDQNLGGADLLLSGVKQGRVDFILDFDTDTRALGYHLAYTGESGSATVTFGVDFDLAFIHNDPGGGGGGDAPAGGAVSKLQAVALPFAGVQVRNLGVIKTWSNYYTIATYTIPSGDTQPFYVHVWLCPSFSRAPTSGGDRILIEYRLQRTRAGSEFTVHLETYYPRYGNFFAPTGGTQAYEWRHAMEMLDADAQPGDRYDFQARTIRQAGAAIHVTYPANGCSWHRLLVGAG